MIIVITAQWFRYIHYDQYDYDDDYDDDVDVDEEPGTDADSVLLLLSGGTVTDDITIIITFIIFVLS